MWWRLKGPALIPHHEGLLMSRQGGMHFFIDPWEMHRWLNSVILKRIIQNSSLVPRYGIALTWMPTRINDKESGSGNGWYRQARSYHLSLCWWPRSMSPHGVTMSTWVNTLRPRQVDAISQTIFSNAFSWMKMYEFRLKFHWSLFPRVQLPIFQQWVR